MLLLQLCCEMDKGKSKVTKIKLRPKFKGKVMSKRHKGTQTYNDILSVETQTPDWDAELTQSTAIVQVQVQSGNKTCMGMVQKKKKCQKKTPSREAKKLHPERLRNSLQQLILRKEIVRQKPTRQKRAVRSMTTQ